MSKHTPGEWFKGRRMSAGRVAVSTRDGNMNDIAIVVGWTEAEANAALIAAAPDLLEALRGVLRVADRKTDEFDAAHAAIAKATS